MDIGTKNKKIKLIYILGTSFSGSTLLGLILGSSERVVNLGELKFYNRVHSIADLKCSCGERINDCPFWLNFWNKYPKVYETASFFSKFSIALKILFRFKFKKKFNYNSDDYFLLKDISGFLKDYDLYFVDASKSLWRLIYLMNCPEIELKIIYLKRDIEGSTSSFVKHRLGFAKGLAIYGLNNYLIKLFVGVNKPDLIKIDYKNFCDERGKTINAISEFLGIDLKIDAEKIKIRDYHIPSGNPKAKKYSDDNLKIIYDNSWESGLNKFYKMILTMLK